MVKCVGRFIDMTGWVMKEHGVPESRLTIIGRAENGVGPNGYPLIRWLCECNCKDHNCIIADTYSLTSGHTKSCGCLRNEVAAKRGHNMWKKENTFDISGQCGIGYDLSGNEFYFDLEDYEKVKSYCWHVSKDGYVTAMDTKEKHIIRMHRLIMGFPNGDIDHINHKLNDNRKQNLRVCHHMENMMNQSKRSDNTSGVSGVNFHKSTGKWHARIGVRGERINLGLFNSFEDAVKARKLAEEQFYKEFSYDNSTKENNNELQ